MDRRRNAARRWMATLVASLTLHGLVFLKFCGDTPRPRLIAPSPQQEAALVEFDVVATSPLAADPAPNRIASQDGAPSVAPKPSRRPSAPDDAVRTPPETAETTRSGSDEDVDATVKAQVHADVPTAPAPPQQRGTLVLVPSPSLGAQLGTGGLSADEDSKRGVTIRNSPEELPDARAVAEYTEEKLKRKLDSELAGEVGAARVQNGLAPRYFNRVQGALRDTLATTPVELDKKKTGDAVREGVKDAVETWLLPAQQYGATGSPVTSREDTRDLEESGLGRTMEQGWRPIGSDEAQVREMNQAMQALAATEVLKRSARRERLRTIVALQQDWSGALAEVRIVKPSNDEVFDAWVLHVTRKVLRLHGERDHDEVDLPFQPEGWHSEWQFTYEPPNVRVKLLRVMPGPLPPPAP